MLLTGSSGTKSLAATGAQPAPGDTIALHFSVATPNGQQHYRTQATIARVTEAGNGIGVRFDEGMPEDAFSSLIEFAIASGMLSRSASTAGQPGDADQAGGDAAAGTRAAADDSVVSTQTGADIDRQIPEDLFRDRRISDADADEIRTRIRRVAQRALDRICSQFFGIVDNELLVKARDAGTNAVQMIYFEGLELIEKNRDQIRNDFIGEALKQIDTVSELEDVLERRRRQDTGNTTKLEIVDTEQFEEWLAVAEIISKAENRYTNQLLDLRAQLGMVAKPWTHKDVIPIGPAVLAWSFDDALKEFEFRRAVKQDIYHCFENALIPVLGNLYAALAKLLEDSKVFPSVEELRESLQRASIRRTPSGVRVEPEAYQDMDYAVREATMAADGISTSASRVDHNPFVPQASGSSNMYGAARNLLGLERQTRSLLGRGTDEILATPDTSAADTFRTEDILSALSDIEGELGDTHLGDVRLKPRLIELLQQRHGQGKRISEEDYDTLDVMENLVGSMRQDELLTEGIRDWIQRLELTLNKLAATDPAFLREESEQPHGAVQMLNQLARLGNSKDIREGIDREVGKRVDELLQKVVSEYDENPKVFDEVVDELNPLVDKQTRAYRGNIERTIRASEGQQKLARARKAVVSEIEERVDGKSVPELLLELLNPGWRNLMVHTHLRQGKDSAEWKEQLQMVDQLWGQLSGEIDEESEDYVDPDMLLKRVVGGLNSISFDPSKRTPLIMKLSSALVGDTTGERTPVKLAQVEQDEVEEALGLKGLLPETELDIQSDDEDLKVNWSKAVDRAKRIQVGEWLATSDAQGLPLILSVAFVGDDASSFVLVNRKGIKNREMQLKEMADGLHEGRVTLLEDYDLPLMERASQRMLENMHGQLTYQACHDDLTQLANRKEFERIVERAIADAKAHESQHALLYLDLDQFKIVNNTSGHTAGDECLKLVADTVTRTVSNRKAEIARLGGDEFGVLVREVETLEARELAEDLLNAVRKERFEWDGREYSLSASMGLVFIDQTTESVDAAMQFADEACYTAKDAGRNRLQEYELGDATMMRRHGVMEWVTELDKALHEERLILNCQRIVPISRSGSAGADEHYEILLTMRDELGETMPPTDFIIAAETYNRMTAIDRWVIESVLNWMAVNRDQLDHFGGFSINVSGHSINDETFPDFVLEQFSNTQAPTGKVCFEITETAAIANLDNAIDFMNRMKIIGCQFSLDDFGTGLSSYSYLRNLPVDFVKIDGVFVKDIANNPGDYAVVRSINEIGHYMGKKTIAEYVEDEAVLERLREIGVDYAQGYEIEKPLPLDELHITRKSVALG